MQKSKKAKPVQAHTSKSSKGMGDYYGTGARQKLGRLIEGTGMKMITPKKLKKPPKSLA